MIQKSLLGAAIALLLALPAHADTCSQLASKHGLTYAALTSALQTVVPESGTPNGGLGFPMWLSLVDGSGKVCAVTNSLRPGQTATADIWLGSRIISAQKANTGNSFSIGPLALSSANLYAAVQPGGSLFGLQESNPVDPTVAYAGPASAFGTPSDPLLGERIGGINVFGGGLALYSAGVKIGAIGVSGDTSCTDHVVAWKVRAALGFPFQKSNTAQPYFDQMIQNTTLPLPFGGFTHPTCLNNPTAANDGGSIYH